MEGEGEGEGEALSRILSELETNHFPDTNDFQTPISEASLSDLQALFDAGDGDHLWDHLASNNLPISTLAGSISGAMDSSDPRLSLLASRSYLSILASPSSPLYTFFTPVAFVSLLRSLRRSLKSRPSDPISSTEASSSHGRNIQKRGRKRKEPRRPCEEGMVVGQRTDISDLLLHVLKLLEAVLGRIRLDGSPDGVKTLVETMADMLGNSAGQHPQLPDLCTRILHEVVSRPEHGDQTASAVEVLKSLAPAILSTAKSPVRASVLGFVMQRMVPMARENGAVRKALVYLPRYLAMKVPAKSEPRACAVSSILEIVGVMDSEDQVGFANYVVQMARGKAHLRLLGVDLILALLTSLADPLGVEHLEVGGGEDVNTWWGRKCLQALVLRCSDIVAGIRARALTNVAQVVGYLSVDVKNHSLLQNLMGFGNHGFIALLRKRCMDEKAAVRKAALLVIMKSIVLIGGSIDELLLKTIGWACSDPLVSIRKVAVSALSEVYRKSPDSRVIIEWIHAVPRLIADNETSIKDECENLFLELVLDWISRVGNAKTNSNPPNLESVLPEGLLVLLKEVCDGEVAPCVKKICACLGKKKRLKATVATSLQNIIASSESVWLSKSMPIEKWTAPEGAWLLLSEVSFFVPKAIGWEFLHHHWKLFDKVHLAEVDGVTNKMEINSASWAVDRVSLLQTISNVAMELPPEPAVELAHNLLKRIEDFSMHLTEVDAHVKALKTLCKQKAVYPGEGDTLVSKWVNQVLTKALKIIDNYVSEASEVSDANNFLTPRSDRSKRKKKASELQAMTSVFTVGSLVLACPHMDLKGIVPLLHTIITSGVPTSKPNIFPGLTISLKDMAPNLYVQSWVTMGKICLVDGKLAKRYIPLFVKELESSDSAAVRNNIMVVMADFCVRYTALVDCYIPRITNSLRDPCEVIRRQTFILLSRLLQRDYVKWKGVLFLRFLFPLVDDSEKIRRLADYLFGNILKVKAPLLAYNSFIEAIFVLNDCHAHAGHSENNSQVGTQLFSIRGNDEKSRSKRMHIYVSLLKQMAPEQLLATSAKLCAEILASASDGLLNLDDVTGQAVLQDALQILACKEMRIQPNRSFDATEVDEEGGDGGGGASVQAARGRAITEVSKKNLIHHAVPIFIELKRLLESKNSPLIGCLMECLLVLLKDFKNEFEDILVADKQLQKELIYDMQKYEKAKANSTVREAVANLQRSGGFRSPTNQGNESVYARVSEKLGTCEKITSAVADVAAKAMARSVLKEVNGNVPTPQLRNMSLPKVQFSKDAISGASRRDRSMDVLESLRRRQTFDSDEEN